MRGVLVRISHLMSIRQGVRMRLLLVDESWIKLRSLETMLRKAGYHDLLFAQNPSSVCELLKLDEQAQVAARIDLIILDYTLPHMNGIEMCRRIRSHACYREIPIIMMTGMRNESVLQEAFEAGVTDFVRKPVRKVEFLARVRAALRLQENINKHYKAREKLEKMVSEHEYQLALAKKVQMSVLNEPIEQEQIAIQARYVPSEHLSGDMYCWYEIGNGCYGIMLIDVVGHGVSASLVSMSVRALLRGLITRVTDPVHVMQELNRHMLHIFKDNDISIYFTALYVVIDVQARKIEYVNAGHPPGIVRGSKGEMRYLSTGCLPIGLLPDIQVEKEVFSYEGETLIAMFSDGLANGNTVLAPDSIASFMIQRSKAGQSLDCWLNEIMQTHATEEAKDDICLIGIHLR